MSLEAGRQLGPYEIVAPLGAGGMGEVYRAKDSRLGREVAIKVLPAELAASADRLRRFEQEARAASALNHQNILTVFDVGTHEGKPFLVTELLVGHSLRETLSKGEKLASKRVLDLAAQIAQGLAAAHAMGIVHRDLKPENIFLCADGRIKILDFGLAKLTAPAGERLHDATTLAEPTASGTILGTVGYMSPEQVRGEAADARSDLFSFGCVLYELLSGRRAFRRETHAETMTAILREEPEPLAEVAPLPLPAGLSELLEHCLEKTPERRFQSARDLAFQLEVLARSAGTATVTSAVSAATPSSAIPGRPSRRGLLAFVAAAVLLALGSAAWRMLRPATSASEGDRAAPAAERTIDSLAVLPFRNLGASAEQEYLSDGISEELINVLGRLPGLRVAGRTSSFTFKGKDVDLSEVGARLKVESVLEGSVQAEGDRLRVRVQLVSCSDGFQLWSESYDRETKDIFAVQEEIARAIAARLHERLAPTAVATATEVPKTDPETYELYLKGVRLYPALLEKELREARSLLEEATRRDPRFAPAWARLAHTILNLHSYDAPRSESYFSQAEAAARRAVDLAPALPDGHVAMAHLAYYRADLAEMERSARRALEVNPNHSRSRIWYGRALVETGRVREGLLELAAGVRLDPVDFGARVTLGTYLVLERRFGESIAELEEANRLTAADKANAADWWLVFAYGFDGRTDEAVDLAERWVERTRESPVDQVRWKIALAWADGRAGRTAEGRRLLDELETAPREVVTYDQLAGVAAAIGEKNRALDYLALYERAPDAIASSLDWPWLDPVRSEPRFREIQERLMRRDAAKMAGVGH
ncbi:MAG: protein kinase [Thermoanaerobaculia bacterium]|nr:protein kinase [Thermoanaerobaculia bacterium]